MLQIDVIKAGKADNFVFAGFSYGNFAQIHVRFGGIIRGVFVHVVVKILRVREGWGYYYCDPRSG